jgi:HEAT repeat protein
MIGRLLAAVLLLASSQERGMKELIELLGAPAAEVRDQAFQELVSRWKRWGLEDLEILAENRPGDLEVAARAREALSRIRIRRALGDTLIKTIPGLESACLSRNEEKLLEALDRAEQLSRNNGIDGSDMVLLLRWISDQKWSERVHDRMRELQKKGFIADPKLMVPLLKDGDPTRQLSALDTLARLRARPLAAHIVPLLIDGHPDVRFQAARTLAILRARDQAAQVAEFLDRSPGRRMRIVELLGDMGAQEMAPRIVPSLKDPQFNLRRIAVLSLAKMRARTCSAEIAALLEDSNPTVRREAVLALGTLEANHEIPRIEALLDSKDPGTRAAAAATLAELRHAGDGLLPLLKDPDVEVRLQAAAALGRSGERKFATPIRALLSDDNLWVRAAVLDACGRLCAPSDSDAVVPFVTHAHPLIREKAIEALGRAGALDRRPLVVEATKDREGRVRAAALAALQRLQGAALQDLALPFLQDPDPMVREQAIAVLGTSSTRAVLNHLRERVRDDDPRVRKQAAEVISAIGEAEDLSDVQALLDDPVPWVRARVTPMVGRMAAKWTKGAAREKVVYALRASEKDSDWEVEAGAGIGLLLLGEKDRAAQRMLVEEFMRPGLAAETRLTQELLEALSQVHECATFEKWSEARELAAPIDSLDAFGRFLAPSKLALTPTSKIRIQGSLPKGTTQSPRDVAKLAAFPMAVLLSGESVSLLPWHEALERWVKRLK